MQQYLALMRQVRDTGVRKEDRIGGVAAAAAVGEDSP